MSPDIFLDLTKGQFPIIISPNLGQPVFLNLHEEFKQSEREFKFTSYIIAFPSHSIQRILESFTANVYIQPILREEGEFKSRRGDLYPIKPKEIRKMEKTDFENLKIIEERDCIIQDFYKTLLEIEEIFGKRENLYEIDFEISRPVINAISQLLEIHDRKFLLFDIIHEIPNSDSQKTNFHSIAIFNKDWSNFKFIQASDLHIARRNDFIIEFLKKKARTKVEKCQEDEKKLAKVDNFILRRDYEFKEGFQEEKLDELKYAKFNFNYNLRKLIEFINRKVSSNDCDFVLLTGDLIDYLDIGRGDNSYKNNVEVLVDIILGLNKSIVNQADPEFRNQKELLAPIFTILGNHDYHKGLYGLRLAGIHNIFGIKHAELSGYHDIKLRQYIYSFYSRDKFISDYLRYINPNCNYLVSIGNDYNFIFLDTGADSIADFHDLMKGGASTKGLKDYQIELLRTYITLSLNKKIIIVMHTPPVSPNLSSYKKRKYRKEFNLKRKKLDWSNFYEENLVKFKETARLEQILNMKYQTIMYNWSTFLKICTGSDKVIRRKIDLVLCGHTHSIKEYRLRETDRAEIINYGFWALPFFIEIPCEIYTSEYRKKIKEFPNKKNKEVWFDVNKPFVLQTQALGPLSAKFDTKSPGFRYIKIKNDKVTSLDIFSLHLR